MFSALTYAHLVHTIRHHHTGTNRAGYAGPTWSLWFSNVLTFIDEANVRVWSYIDVNWDIYPMYTSHQNRANGVHWGDSRIQHYPGMAKYWTERVLRTDTFSWSAMNGGNYDRNIYCEPTDTGPASTIGSTGQQIKIKTPADSTHTVSGKHESGGGRSGNSSYLETNKEIKGREDAEVRGWTWSHIMIGLLVVSFLTFLAALALKKLASPQHMSLSTNHNVAHWNLNWPFWNIFNAGSAGGGGYVELP